MAKIETQTYDLLEEIDTGVMTVCDTLAVLEENFCNGPDLRPYISTMMLCRKELSRCREQLDVLIGEAMPKKPNKEE